MLVAGVIVPVDGSMISPAGDAVKVPPGVPVSCACVAASELQIGG